MRYLFICLSVLCVSFAHAQINDNIEPLPSLHQVEESVPPFMAYEPRRRRNGHSIYLEILGAGGFGSINYEWRFLKHRNWEFLLRPGFSFVPIDSNNGAVLVFPVLAHALYGGGSHKLDIGFGQTLSVTTKGGVFLRAPMSFGYRLNPRNSRMFYRIAYTPIASFLLERQWEHWAGVSIGIKIK